MSKLPIIKTREPGPEFQALASDWKPTKRRAWLVQPPPPESVVTTKTEGTPTSVAPAQVVRPSDPAHARTGVPAEGVGPFLAVPTESAPARTVAPTIATPKLGPTGLATADLVASVLAGPTKPAGAPALAVGWTKMPNALLETLMCTDLGSRALRVLLYLTRQTSGFHRESVELSYVDIANATNVGQAKLPEVLRELTSRGFIKRTSGNGKKNRFSVRAVSGAAMLAGPTEVGPTNTASTPATDSAGATSCQFGGATEADFANTIAPLRGDLEPLKKLLFKETLQRNSLSQPPPAWQRYTDTLTEKARERASSIFEGLKQRFPDDDANEIAEGPENLRAFGAPDGTLWAEIKSPHGLMESSWPQLRDFFRGKHSAKRKASQASAEHVQQRDAQVAAASAEDQALALEAKRAREAFDTKFATDQERAIALDRFKPTWVTNAQAEPGRSLAIHAWFSISGLGRGKSL